MVAAAALAGFLAACAAGPSPAPIDAARALEIARAALAKVKPEAQFVVLEEKTAEKEFGWVFFYAPRRYLDTGDPGALVPGAGPLVVERATGATKFLSSSVPPVRAIAEYEKRWRRRAARSSPDRRP